MKLLLAALSVLAISVFAPTAFADDANAGVTPVQGNGGYHPPKPKKGFRYPDCFCTDSKGQRVEMGMTSCLQIGSQKFLARCAMSLNNPTWRRIDDKCPAPST